MRLATGQIGGDALSCSRHGQQLWATRVGSSHWKRCLVISLGIGLSEAAKKCVHTKQFRRVLVSENATMNIVKSDAHACQSGIGLRRGTSSIVKGANTPLPKRGWRSALSPLAAIALAVLGRILFVDPCFAVESLTLEGSDPVLNFIDTDTSQTWYVYGKSDRFAVLDVGGVATFTIAPGSRGRSLFIKGNNVGFGTDDPLRELHVVGSDTPALRLEQNTLGGFQAKTWGVEANDAAFSIHDVSLNRRPIRIESGAPNRTLHLTAAGNLGAGTDTPTSVASATNLPGRIFNLKTTDVGTAGLARLVAEGAAGAQLHLIHSAAPANQRVMRIQNVNGLTAFNSVKDDMVTNLVTGAIIIKNLNGNIGLRNTNPQHPLHLASGAHCTSGGVWTNASSRELKEKIEPITGEQAREAVLALRPVVYRYKAEEDERYVGFIAEDVPELVATKDRKSLSPMDITAVLTRVVQDQDRIVQQQAHQLAAERQRNNELEQRVDSLLRRMEEMERREKSR